MKKLLFRGAMLLMCGCSLAAQLLAQTDIKYQTPPQSIMDLVNAPSTPVVSIDSKGEWMVLLMQSELPSIAELSQPELRLAGLRINPNTNGPSRAGYTVGIKLRKVMGKEEIEVKGMPAHPLISNVSWSPDEKKIAFTHTTDKHIELWVIDVATATAKRVGNFALNSVLGSPFEWLNDSNRLLCTIVPPGRGAAPLADNVPQGPVIQENVGKRAPARTYQDLLKSPSDEKIFEYYATAQAVITDLNGLLTTIGETGMIGEASASPDGRFVMMQVIKRPFSYLVPVNNFPYQVAIYDAATGKQVKILTDRPLAENLPTGFDAVPTGPRRHSWRADAPATITWVEAQDEGDPKKEVPIRDRVFALSAPFDGQAKEILATKFRFTGITWGNEKMAFARERWWATRKEVVHIIHPDAQTAPVVLFDRSYEDTYTDPGTPRTKRNAFGRNVLDIQKDNTIYFFGTGASPEGDRPFVDLFNLTTKKANRLWRSEAPYYERPVDIINNEKQLLITVRESTTENPNYFLRDLKKKQLIQLTTFPNPYEGLKGVTKQLIKYKRADGVEMSADLYLPAGYKKEDGPLPSFVWAYPREYKSAAAAGQVSGSPYRFTRLSWGSPIFWVTRGYAVFDNAAMPIVGEGDKQPNDSFVQQLDLNAKALIEEGTRLGVMDKNRVAVGGHSYGAFMTANLLAHTDYFCAGIARSGAYNRTLTPFGFQSEERTLWEVPEIYSQMSPFMYANKIKEPILLIHGEADNNSGTFPIQSERFYNALKGHGAITRFVLLPHESHGYRAKESVMHMLWEMDQWLEKYVKNAKSN
jgi:dipeptidyl aminopeptidase/acylaminoacyl peptidase